MFICYYYFRACTYFALPYLSFPDLAQRRDFHLASFKLVTVCHFLSDCVYEFTVGATSYGSSTCTDYQARTPSRLVDRSSGSGHLHYYLFSSLVLIKVPMQQEWCRCDGLALVGFRQDTVASNPLRGNHGPQLQRSFPARGALQIDMEALRKLCWSGIPPDLRPTCWRLLLGYLPVARSAVFLRGRRAGMGDTCGCCRTLQRMLQRDVPFVFKYISGTCTSKVTGHQPAFLGIIKLECSVWGKGCREWVPFGHFASY